MAPKSCGVSCASADLPSSLSDMRNNKKKNVTLHKKANNVYTPSYKAPITKYTLFTMPLFIINITF